MAKRRGVPRDPHRWWQVRLRGWCARGSHDVAGGTWMRTRRDDHRQLHSCEACLVQAGIARPTRAVTLSGGFDVRAKRAGKDE